MRKRLTSIVLASICVLGAPAFANESGLIKLEKGTVLVQDFGDIVDLDELYEGLKANNIHANRVRLSGRTRYEIKLAVYNGDNYSMYVNRQTGEISWISKLGLGAALID